MFGDNLSMISDTTIAATKGDGVDEWASWLSEQIEAAK